MAKAKAKARRKYARSFKAAPPEHHCSMCDCPLSGEAKDTYWVPLAKTPICHHCSGLAQQTIRGATGFIQGMFKGRS